MFDLKRVEVLKGPQGTLYDRNTTAGAINFITVKPSQEKDAYFTASLGNYERIEHVPEVSFAVALNARKMQLSKC